MFEHKYIGERGHGHPAWVLKRSYVIIRPKVVVRGRKSVNFRGVLQCKCNAENTNSPETQ